MTHAEFAQLVTLAFQLVAPGSHVSVEAYCCQFPPHPKGGQTAAMTIWQGPERWLVAYDPKLIGRGPRSWWVQTAFHEACHAGLNRFGQTRKEQLAAERAVDDCAEKWMENVRRGKLPERKKEKQK